MSSKSSPAKAPAKGPASAKPAPAELIASLPGGRAVEATVVTTETGRPTLHTHPQSRPVAGATLASAVAAAGRKTKRADSLAFHERPIDELWREYRVRPSKELRNFLIEKYLELVRFTAERMHMKLPSEVEVDDLMSAGLFGLMDAIDAFDPDRGVKFETYCTQRIRGAIFDELRAMDWVPRLVRSRTAKVEKVRKQIEMETGRKATDAEIADRMKVAKPEFEKLQKDSRPVGIVSLNRKWFETDSSKDVREIDVIRDAKQESPVQQIQRQDLHTLITKGLSRAERLIVILYYYEEMTMKEIGTTLDLSESRVSQMHSSILARLKAQMQHREKDMED
jgi:RNA polymerase sigma factor for flagellar operon FliA